MTTLSALQDLFQRCREGATGQWRLGSDPQRNIFFDRGRIVFAQSTHPLDRLTHLLVEKGRLTQDQMDYAMSNLQPGMSVGKNLIQLGFITQRDLLDMAKLQVERVVWGAIGTANVAPIFMAKDLDATVVRLSLDTPALLLGGLLNLKDRERLLELLGPLSQVMVLDRVKLERPGSSNRPGRIPASSTDAGRCEMSRCRRGTRAAGSFRTLPAGNGLGAPARPAGTLHTGSVGAAARRRGRPCHTRRTPSAAGGDPCLDPADHQPVGDTSAACRAR